MSSYIDKLTHKNNTICIAPMINYTDRHCRYLFRLLTKRAMLYTEMISSAALIQGNQQHLLDFSIEEQPVALQLGGSNPVELAKAAKMGEVRGYQEINLNVGCPSARVKKGNIGACLMDTPEMVAQCVDAMAQAVDIPVTVKHRTGIKDTIQDLDYTYDRLAQFIDCVASRGCQSFIVHARMAILNGLNPKDNRNIPPLDYETVYRLKDDFPDIPMIINGGINTIEAMEPHLKKMNGVMVGRMAYQHPYGLHQLDRVIFKEIYTPFSRFEILHQMIPYIEKATYQKVPLHQITRHFLGLFHGLPNARYFRRSLTDLMQNTQAHDVTCFRALLDRWETEDVLHETMRDEVFL